MYRWIYIHVYICVYNHLAQAPADSRARITSLLAEAAARCSGVRPLWSAALAFALALRSKSAAASPEAPSKKIKKMVSAP